MRVMFVAPEFPFGGAEKQMYRLAKELKQHGLKPCIMNFGSDEAKTEDIEIINRNIGLFEYRNFFQRIIKIIRAYRIVKHEIKERNPDCVIFFSYIFLLFSMFKCKKTRKIFSIRECRAIFFKFYTRFLLQRFDTIFTNNIPTKVILGCYNIDSFVINNIVYKEYEDVDISNIKKNKEFILISNITRQKNIEDAIYAFNELYKEGYKLKIIGQVKHKEYYEELKSIVKYDNIEFVGRVNETKLQEYYIHSEALIHTSRFEGTPNAVLDAISYKKPFVISDISEHEVLCESNNQYIYALGRYEELIEKVKRLHDKIVNNELLIKKDMNYYYEKLNFSYSERNALRLIDVLRNKK